MKKVGTGASWNMPKSNPASRITMRSPNRNFTSRTMAKNTATHTRIQKVAGNRSRFSSARFRQTSVMTLVTDMAAASRSPIGAKPRLSMCGLLCHQLHRPQHAAGERAHTHHVLCLKLVAVFGDQVLVIGKRSF